MDGKQDSKKVLNFYMSLHNIYSYIRSGNYRKDLNIHTSTFLQDGKTK